MNHIRGHGLPGHQSMPVESMALLAFCGSMGFLVLGRRYWLHSFSKISKTSAKIPLLTELAGLTTTVTLEDNKTKRLICCDG